MNEWCVRAMIYSGANHWVIEDINSYRRYALAVCGAISVRIMQRTITMYALD